MNKDKAIQWVVGNDVGRSSLTMLAAVMDVSDYVKNPDVPCDISDFGRCYRLAKYAEFTKEDLQKVKDSFPFFAPIIDNWDKLCNAYDNDVDFYDLLRSFDSEIMNLKGYVLVEKGYWQKR